MIIDTFLSMKDGENMTAAQAGKLNIELAKISVIDIDAVHKEQIADYLITALNMNSIDESLLDTLENLLQSIQCKK